MMKGLNCMKLVMLLMAAFPAIAAACVDTRSGAACYEHEDIVLTSGDRQLKLVRRYDSAASTRDGWFGYGWSTPFEVRLMVMPDSSVLIVNPVSGAVDRFELPDAERLRVGVERIIEKVSQSEHLDPGAIAMLRGKLLASELLRREYVATYAMKSDLQLGERARSSKCDKSAVMRTTSGYRRISCDNDVDEFDLQGRLVAHQEGRYWIRIHYAGARPDQIRDSEGQILTLKWGGDAHISEVQAGGAQMASYRYEGGNLVQEKVSSEQDYRFNYDGGHHLLQLDVPHPDAKQLRLVTNMRYDERWRVAESSDSDGDKHSYEYHPDVEQPDLHFIVMHKIVTGDGLSRSRQAEYQLIRDDVGIVHLAKVSKTDGEMHEEILLDQYERGVSLKKSNGEFFEVAYDERLGKVASLLTQDGRKDFRYDQRGNMIWASQDSIGCFLNLSYDNKSRVVRIVEQCRNHGRRVLSLVYDSQDRPAKIRVAGKQDISVQYDAAGKIANADSMGGSKVVVEVLSIFQSLLMVTPNFELCI